MECCDAKRKRIVKLYSFFEDGGINPSSVYCAALQKFAEHEDTQAYVADLENMHKVVLGVSDEVKLAFLSQRLEGEHIDFVLWREQPENILTALALRPYQKKVVRNLLIEYPLLN
ncbi:putative peptidyl-tRNA hydrolase PTRHD1 [Taenia crassiceps]|uniref:peptidyl-tRNA hydrolase n=1 Tax=Taenia crassiceps TaxID=6207 RepID=A0ABR4QA01_9CEST